MSRALIIGIDYYEHSSQLIGCVKDAENISALLSENEDGSVNFDCMVMTSGNKENQVRRQRLRQQIQNLFKHETDIALLYFAGHGHIEASGGYIMASDSEGGNDGVSLTDILIWANNSPARNKVIILDSCFSGGVGNNPFTGGLATISEGLTILAASTSDQFSYGTSKGGVFTTLMVDALSGGAASLLGQVTPGSIYAHIDQSLGDWDQRPVFKTNVKQFISLRLTKPRISLTDLKKISTYFKEATDEYPLNPSYEPRNEGRTSDMPPADPANNEIFAVLQQYNRLNLLVPVGADHMWNAAMESKSCKLTPLGRHYHRLAKDKRLKIS